MFIQRIILIDYNLPCQTADSVLLAAALGNYRGPAEDMIILFLKKIQKIQTIRASLTNICVLQ